MDAPLPRSRFSLDLLIAEAKRRMRRRRVLAVVAAAAAAVALMLTVQPWGGSGGGGHKPGAAARDAGIAQIPGMTRVAVFGTTAMASCNETIDPMGHYPHYCSVIQPVRGQREEWILTSAYEEGFRWNATVAFAVAHPGPVVVTDEWTTFASPQDLALYMREPDLGGAPAGCDLRGPFAVNGGFECRGDADFVQRGTQRQRIRQGSRGTPGGSFAFRWIRGTTLVQVGVSGVGLTGPEARQIALLARPR